MSSAQWAVNCHHCNKEFPQSDIPEPHTIDYLFPQKPDIPVGGQELECPRCKSKSTYEATDLWYLAANI